MSFLLMGVAPVILFAWVGSEIRNGADARQAAERWLLFLLGIIALLLAWITISILSFDQRTPPSAFIVLPSLWGSLAAVLLHVFSSERAWPRNHLTWVLSGMIVIQFIALGFSGDPSLLPVILAGGVWIALVWRAWRWASRWTVAAYILLVLLLLLALWNTDRARPLFEGPAWLASIVQVMLFLIPGAAVIVAARLVQAGFGSETQLDWRRLVPAWVAVIIIMFLLSYQVMLASIWDVATDGLSGIFLVGMNSLAGIASGLLLAWKLAGRRKMAAFLFAAIVPVIMIGAERLGTFDRDGEWGTLPIIVTESRAEKIDQAIRRFQAEHGSYPQTLQELAPRYLLYIPVPYIIRGQDWCYESGEDYYRFGYVYREMFSLPAEARVHAMQGEPPDNAWECDQEAIRYQNVPGF
jgi:MFS family permease